MLIALEGIDGAGKTDLLLALARQRPSWIALTVSVLVPGMGELLRQVLQLDDGTVRAYATQALCAGARYTARSLALDAKSSIRRTVIFDRYKYSSLVYGTCLGLDASWCESLEAVMPDPDLVFLLDITPSVAFARRKRHDALEADLGFQTRLRQRYLELAATQSWTVLDAELSTDNLAAGILVAVDKHEETYQRDAPTG